jgi:hypothetical protein
MDGRREHDPGRGAPRAMNSPRGEKGPWTPDHAAYAYALELSPFGWAWEFLRRNPAYRREARARLACDAARGDKAQVHHRRPDGGLWVVERRPEPEAGRWGLEHFVDPDRRADDAAVFWTEDALGGDLDVFLKLGFDVGPDALRLADIPGRKAVLIRPGVRVRLLVEGPGYAEMLGAPAPAEPPPDDVSLALGVGGWSGLDAQLARLAAFAAFCRTGGVGPTPRRRSARRLLDVLVALDGWLDGRAYREIAHAFHHPEEIEGDWRGPGAIKLRMRRRVAGGVAMMGGYRRLLTAGRSRRKGRAE